MLRRAWGCCKIAGKVGAGQPKLYNSTGCIVQSISMCLDTSHLEMISRRIQDCDQVWVPTERNDCVQQQTVENNPLHPLEMVFSQCECSRKRARRSSPVRTTLLSQSSTVQVRTKQACSNIIQQKPGKQCRRRCWVLHSPGSRMGLCCVLPTPTRFTPATEHLLT